MLRQYETRNCYRPMITFKEFRRRYELALEKLDEENTFCICRTDNTGAVSVAAREEDASTAVQAAIANLPELSSISGFGGLIQTSSG